MDASRSATVKYNMIGTSALQLFIVTLVSASDYMFRPSSGHHQVFPRKGYNI